MRHKRDWVEKKSERSVKKRFPRGQTRPQSFQKSGHRAPWSTQSLPKPRKYEKTRFSYKIIKKPLVLLCGSQIAFSKHQFLQCRILKKWRSSWENEGRFCIKAISSWEKDPPKVKKSVSPKREHRFWVIPYCFWEVLLAFGRSWPPLKHVKAAC